MIGKAVAGWVGFVGLVTWVGYRWASAGQQVEQQRAHARYLAEQSRRMMDAATLDQYGSDLWSDEMDRPEWSRPAWLDMDEAAE